MAVSFLKQKWNKKEFLHIQLTTWFGLCKGAFIPNFMTTSPTFGTADDMDFELCPKFLPWNQRPLVQYYFTMFAWKIRIKCGFLARTCWMIVEVLYIQMYLIFRTIVYYLSRKLKFKPIFKAYNINKLLQLCILCLRSCFCWPMEVL